MTLRAAIDQYIAFRQAQGAHFTSQANALRHYSRSVGDDLDCDSVTDSQASTFLEQGGRPGSNNRAWKHSMLAGFYGYACARGLATRSPLPTERPKRVPPAPPHVYSHDELRRLLAATETYRNRANQLETQTFRTLILLLYGTGLRPGEAFRLTQSDVHLSDALLTVRATKCYKSRLVPVGPQLMPVLRQYTAWRKAQGADLQGHAPFLSNRDGTPLVHRTVCCAFARLRQAAGVCREADARYQPRLQDLRHSFATRRLAAWYRDGADAQRLLPLLSTYLGHASVAATQVYLTMTPELLHEASLRFERYADGATGDCHD